MKAFFRHLQWVIQTQARITRSKVQVRDQTIEVLRREIAFLQSLLHLNHIEISQLVDDHAAHLQRIYTAHPEIQE